MTVTQIHPISVLFTLPQDTLPRINAAMAAGKLPVTALSPDDKTELDQGTLLTPDNAIDPTTGTIKLKATFPNPNNTLWPGQFVNARLLIGTEQQRADGAVGRRAARPDRPVCLYRQAGFDGGAAGRGGRARQRHGGGDHQGTGARTTVVVTDGQSRLQQGTQGGGERRRQAGRRRRPRPAAEQDRGPIAT